MIAEVDFLINQEIITVSVEKQDIRSEQSKESYQKMIVSAARDILLEAPSFDWVSFSQGANAPVDDIRMKDDTEKFEGHLG